MKLVKSFLRKADSLLFKFGYFLFRNFGKVIIIVIISSLIIAYFLILFYENNQLLLHIN